MSFKFYDDALALRREQKQKLLDAGELRLPTDDERRLMQYQMYVASGSMGSKTTPLYRG
jgi:hypothetical protein